MEREKQNKNRVGTRSIPTGAPSVDYTDEYRASWPWGNARDLRP